MMRAQLRTKNTTHMGDDLGAALRRVVPAQICGVFFADHRADRRAEARERGGDHRLRRKVSHRDGALVALLKRAGVDEIGLDRAGHERCCAHGGPGACEFGLEIERV